MGEGRRLGWHPPSAAGRAHRREDWSRWEPLVPPGGSQGLGPEPRVCAARTAFPEAQVTPPQAELRSQPRSPLLRGRTPEGSQLRAAPREARQRRRPATAGTKSPPGASGKLDQGGRPLPPSGPLPGAPVWAKAASRPLLTPCSLPPRPRSLCPSYPCLGQALTKSLCPGAQQTLDPAGSAHWWRDPFFLCRYILKGLAREHPHTHHLDSPRSMLFSLLYHIRITSQ